MCVPGQPTENRFGILVVLWFSDDLIFKNTPRDIENVLRLMGQERGARFEFECYDLSHLQMLRHFVDRGLVRAPIFIQFVMGVLGGVAAEPEHLAYLKQLGLVSE